jgi:hypothetical protein
MKFGLMIDHEHSYKLCMKYCLQVSSWGMSDCCNASRMYTLEIISSQNDDDGDDYDDDNNNNNNNKKRTEILCNIFVVVSSRFQQ